MPKAKIKRPKMERYTIKDFSREFPNDDACLEWLKNYLYPDGIHCEACERVTKHHKVVSRRSYSCANCGHHVHPTADTIYHKSPTSLKTWFWVIYQMSSTRCGISAKQIERETGVTYKCAWRMCTQVRKMLDESGGSPLSGIVEVDETLVGGKPRYRNKGTGGGHLPGKRKPIVIGAVERGGRVVTQRIDNTQMDTLTSFVKANVHPESHVMTDEWQGYNNVARGGYKHSTILHSSKIYVRGEVHTNTVEGFWSLAKNAIRGVHHGIGKNYIQSYFNEYSFRYNRRYDVTPMFRSFLNQVKKVSN